MLPVARPRGQLHRPPDGAPQRLAAAREPRPGRRGLRRPATWPGAFLLGVGLTLFALRLARSRDLLSARGLFIASVLYLPALSSLLLAARL